MCASESGAKRYLTPDELRDYRTAVNVEEKLAGQLEQLLEEGPLQLFERFCENHSEQEYFDDLSAFRSGLAVGLKLGAFYASEY